MKTTAGHCNCAVENGHLNQSPLNHNLHLHVHLHPDLTANPGGQKRCADDPGRTPNQQHRSPGTPELQRGIPMLSGPNPGHRHGAPGTGSGSVWCAQPIKHRPHGSSTLGHPTTATSKTAARVKVKSRFDTLNLGFCRIPLFQQSSPYAESACWCGKARIFYSFNP